MLETKLATALPAPNAERWFVYIARCNDGSLYTGIARDVSRRLEAHNAGRGARYTRGRGPLALCARRRCASKGDALRLEWAVKRLPRPAKETLIVGRRLAAFARRLTTDLAADCVGSLPLPTSAHPETRERHR